MAAPRKFDAETRERAVRMYHEHLADAQCSKLGARRHVFELLKVKLATLRNWVKTVSSTSSPQAPVEPEEVNRLRREGFKLRRAKKLTGTALAFSQPRS